jgi:hypothetical protein
MGILDSVLGSVLGGGNRAPGQPIGDFEAAGVVQLDEQILRVMNQLMLEAGAQMQGRQGNSRDAAAVMIARNLASR